MNSSTRREAIVESADPLGLAGIEFVEYLSARPQALGQVLELLGFKPVARHRAREVLLYRQGGMNIVINSHAAAPGASIAPDETPRIAAVGLRVRDAGQAHRRALERGAWSVPVAVQPMELHIPAIHGVGSTRMYFIDRWRDFSIWDVDFIPIPGVDPNPPAIAGLHWFGLVQYVGAGRTEDWVAFYREILGFTTIPDHQRFGILPRGTILGSPGEPFYWQIIEPGSDDPDLEGPEQLQRIGLGAPDVPAAMRALRERGVEFFDSPQVISGERGALTRAYLGGLLVELVHDEGRQS